MESIRAFRKGKLCLGVCSGSSRSRTYMCCAMSNPSLFPPTPRSVDLRNDLVCCTWCLHLFSFSVIKHSRSRSFAATFSFFNTYYALITLICMLQVMQMLGQVRAIVHLHGHALFGQFGIIDFLILGIRFTIRVVPGADVQFGILVSSQGFSLPYIPIYFA